MMQHHNAPKRLSAAHLSPPIFGDALTRTLQLTAK
jgi:hypothetical protein